jgi:deoxyribodipyrimidine photo-lyase
LLAAGVELGRDYPTPLVSHAEARETTLNRYAAVRKVEGQPAKPRKR